MLALDPGNRETGWCIVDTITRAPVQGGKDENTLVSGIVSGGAFTVAAIEIIESYGGRARRVRDLRVDRAL